MSNELTQAVQQNGSSLYRIAWRILRHADEVDDVLQDVVLEALELARRTNVDSWPGLLKRLVVCRSLDRLRKRKPVEPKDPDTHVCYRNASPLDNVVVGELAMRLREAIGQLPERQAEVFSFRYFDGSSNPEIAATLGISTDAVATALRKSRLKLSELLSISPDKGKCHEPS